MTGRSAYYCEMIARAGLVVIHTVASPPAVAPFGGARPALGTNPIAFGFPTDGDPLVIDMGTSAFMGTDLQFRARLGTPIPEGVALGPDGQPTTDATAARRGALLPFGGPEGGYKGFGLALAMDALGALTAGTRPADAVSGYVFIAFKPDLFLPPDDYRREVSRRIETIKATPRQTGIEEIRIPGERGYATRARLMREGIEIDRKIYDALGRLAEGEPGSRRVTVWLRRRRMRLRASTPLPRTSASSNSAAAIARSSAARSSFAVSSVSSIPGARTGVEVRVDEVERDDVA